MFLFILAGNVKGLNLQTNLGRLVLHHLFKSLKMDFQIIVSGWSPRPLNIDQNCPRTKYDVKFFFFFFASLMP